jgi:hypothetical protein
VTQLSEDLAVGEYFGSVIVARRSPAGDLWYAQVVTSTGFVLAYEGQHQTPKRAMQDAVARLDAGLRRLADALRGEAHHVARRRGRS